MYYESYQPNSGHQYNSFLFYIVCIQDINRYIKII